MTNLEWNKGIEYLQKSEYGDYIKYKNRKVSVENMMGGKFLCLEDGEVIKLVDTEVEAMMFLAGMEA
jgi:hypothetical protein